ncbi:MAG: 2-C-methyl-D-erythritol 2,4-cyclodiphosphate synthase [Clostridiales bacterium]|nr:MAG: 2-C-methyl-D-erythritol 2,4-cyclodiphosphate synthase [Clostridiales bacterium]
MRVGLGYDVHRLVEGRKLIIGGVVIPFEKGLAGHSDADVLTHAIIDALLGAAGLGDIGLHFPDDDDTYKDSDSIILLKRAQNSIFERGYRVNNIDATVVCQRPKLRPYIAQMEAVLAAALQIEKSQLNIKATTTEKLGFEGEGLGISAQAIVSLVD